MTERWAAAAADADPLNCDTINKVIFNGSNTVMANEVSLYCLYKDLDPAMDKEDADRIHQLLTDIKSR